MRLKRIKIGDIGTVITGNTPPRKDPDNYGSAYPFIKPTDIELDTRFTPYPEECYSEKAFEKYKKSLIPAGSTCVVTIGSIGRKITMAHTDCFINQAMNAVVPSEHYDSYYVFYLLKQNLYKVKSLDSGTSSGRENVSKSVFSGIEVDVHSNLVVQQKIGSILSAYDDLIENNLRRIQLLEEAARCRYKLFMEEEGDWQEKPADKVFDIRIGKTPPREQEQWFNPENDGMKWCSIKDINNSRVFIQETTETVTHQAVQKFNMNIAPKGTVILSFKLTVGKVAITAEDMCTNEAIAHFNPIDYGEVSANYLYFFLREFPFDSLGSTSSIGNAINSKVVKAMPIKLPRRDILQRFNAEIDPYMSLIHNLACQNDRLRQSRDILLPRLMSGEIDLSEVAMPSTKREVPETA